MSYESEETELDSDDSSSLETFQPNILKRFIFIFLIIFVVLPLTLGLVVFGFLTNKPQDLFKIQRDNQRISDLAKLNQLIKTIVESSPNQNILCGSSHPPCMGWSFAPTAPSVNGSGWVKVDFSQKLHLNESLKNIQSQ